MNARKGIKTENRVVTQGAPAPGVGINECPQGH